MGSELIEAATVPDSSSSSKFFPPGFRFHPTDEELILYYLKRKICGRSLKLDIIGQVDVYKWHPEELPGQSKWKTGDRQWFFFSPRDRKYPNGGRSSRGALHGYWKATGRDRTIQCNTRSVGIKKTLVYYQGRAPSGLRTDWVMHEYTLDEEELKRCRFVQEYYALYKVFKKSGLGPKNGEQYGAPFVEEEWLDDADNDDYLDVNALLVDNGPKLTNGVAVEPEIVIPPLAQVNKPTGPSHEPLCVQPGSDLAQSANERSELTLVEEPLPLVLNEDFLELDDLIGSPLDTLNVEPLVPGDLQVADFDGFHEFDLYNNSNMFNELTPFESQQGQEACYYMDSVDYEMQNSGYDLWNGAGSTPSGIVITEGNPEKPPNSGINGEDDGTDSWFSSALWAFVESVPSTPASALESSAIVNKAFERMSSLGVASSRRIDGSSRWRRGIVYYSLVGVLFAILCVFVGRLMELTHIVAFGPVRA